MPAQEVRGLVRFLYTQNPFYLLSTGLILYGLQSAFSTPAAQADPQWAWALVSALFGYTLLMAVTGCLIVRLGGVWQDARSIVLVVLLLFVAISTSFDQICNTSPETARSVLLLALSLTVLISELLLRGLRIRFPWPYRLPYYLLLSAFFLYPLWASTTVTGASADEVAWRVFLFPLICGVIVMSLIPAVRRTANYVKDNGTPWRWPWFPWTVFVFLALGVCGRAVALTYSFVPMNEWSTPFGIYYLTPFAAAVLLLLVEIAAVERLPRLMLGTLLAAPVLLIMSHTSLGSVAYEQFLYQVIGTIGSPLWTALLLLGLIYLYAWWRGARASETGLVATLFLVSVIGPHSRELTELRQPQWLPLVALGAWQLTAGLSLRTSSRAFFGAACLIGGATLRGEGTMFVAHDYIIPLHLALAALVAIALGLDDLFARLLRPCAALGVTVAGAVAVFGTEKTIPFWLTSIYAGALAGLAVVIWYRWRDSIWLLSALGNVMHATAAHVLAFWWAAQRQLGSITAVTLAVGMVFFVLAAAISAVKGGIRPVIERKWHQWRKQVYQD